ncbi:MAG TPA: aldo/keto reductase [Verrucomicrobiae bacterium]|nr:aldo/keto reductase [Verrucomicrobiae bacterium]
MALLPALASDLPLAGAPDKSAGELPIRTLGKTGLQLPILGYGGAGLPTKWGNPLSQEDRVALVRYAHDRGVRYFDTSPGYFESQAIMGEALKDRRRDVCLVTKVDGTRPEAVRRQVETSLKTLQTDHADILLIHGTPGIEQMSVAQAMKIHGEIVKLRDAKMTRFIGFSAHGYFDKALALINSGGFDLCMLACGYVPRGHNQLWTPRTTQLRDACLARAHELGMGIAAMKVIGGGWLGAWSGHLVPGFDKERLAQLPGAAIRHVLGDPRVHMLVIGMRLRKEVDANLDMLSNAAICTPQDRTLLEEFTARLLETDTARKFRVE